MKRRLTEDNWRNDPSFAALVRAFLSCKNDEAMAAFLRDIATLGELGDLCERLEVAKQLARGLSYRTVAANTGASTTTVTRVAKFLDNGEGGYRRILKKSHTEEAPAALTPTEEIMLRRKTSALQKALQKQ